jgi:hypothetical protein
VALIDRVKERIEHDLSDVELQALIDEATAEIDERYGDAADPATPIAVLLDGGGRSVFPNRPIDVDEAVEVVETVVTTETTLAADDYRVWHGGRRLERLNTGTNPRPCWGHPVEITYVPVADSDQRDEIVIKLVQLSIEYEGVSSERVGDTSTNYRDYTTERERLLASLAPNKFLIA